jgi:drug/metabolite transporter (DMT)-like permease
MSWLGWIGIAVATEAAEQILNRRYLSKTSHYWEFLVGYSFGAILLSLILLSGEMQFAQATGATLLGLLLSGVFWFFMYLFNARAYQQVDVSLTSLLTQIQLVLVFFGGIVLFAEPLTLGKLFGTALIVGGISLRGTSFGRASYYGLTFKLLSIIAGAAGFLTDKWLTAQTTPAVIQLWSYAVPTVLVVTLRPTRLATAYRLARDLRFVNVGVGAINALAAYALLHAFAAADISIVYPLYQTYILLTILAAHFLLGESGGLRTKLASAGVGFLGVACFFH